MKLSRKEIDVTIISEGQALVCVQDRQFIFKDKLLKKVQAKVTRKLEKGNRFGNKNTIDNKFNLSFVL